MFSYCRMCSLTIDYLGDEGGKLRMDLAEIVEAAGELCVLQIIVGWYIYIYIYMYVCMYTHTHTHIYIYTYIHKKEKRKKKKERHIVG